MRVPAALALFTLIHALAADAEAKHLVKRATEHFHTAALRHSAGLARDLRTALRGLSAEAPPARIAVRGSTGKTYCVSSKPSGSLGKTPPGANGTSSAAPAPSQSSSSVGKSTAKGSSTAAAPAPTATSNWKLAQSYSGNSFFSGWNFFTGADPTNGIVQFLDQPTAQSSNLTSITSDGNAIMRIDTTPQVSGNRAAVRITTQYSFNGGLVLMDSTHMPTGCGTWPAFWTNGPTWPATGEIDIVEGVNDYTNDQATIHTNAGCNLPSTSPSMSGSIVGETNCAALETGNQGCGVRASSTNSFGAAFNSVGGGVYAMKWDSSGISVYFFQRDSIPSDITAGAPQPANWGQPLALWPSSSCNPYQFFQDHSAIFDTTLCGDWASGVWGASGIPGQEQSCAQRTGVATCEDFVRNNGAALTEAYWEVKSVQIYQPAS
ncbi:glycoside hydrolase family 16 protein [Auriscalpium vulgare]|uniref:Glycoside hydrolase family 16 protein n=1 Tax=Auriscalpium vulgare TaxID=40419 RepID=A0ACB8RUF0_9AGAM|nr:glycoside hydrolase family 16 protein [Auriscalpium vulgare]